jgi:hypothetical protein
MKKLAIVLFLLLLCAVGFGFYRGWFALSSPSSDTEPHQVNVNLAIDADKVKDDAKRVRDATTELTEKPAPNKPDAPADGVKTGDAIE